MAVDEHNLRPQCNQLRYTYTYTDISQYNDTVKPGTSRAKLQLQKTHVSAACQVLQFFGRIHLVPRRPASPRTHPLQAVTDGLTGTTAILKPSNLKPHLQTCVCMRERYLVPAQHLANERRHTLLCCSWFLASISFAAPPHNFCDAINLAQSNLLTIQNSG